jgi:demethylmenaquinone methyltransferase/2-methoxy-6-polyprenyl-1,4-benzoquinol methylase
MKNKLNPNQYNITDIFENVSHAKYDFMNDIMSFGIHRLWKKYYVDLLLDKFNKKEKILDIASGSGDIFQLFPYKSNLYAIDPIDQMHEISKEKNSDKKINYQTGYVENLPYKNNFFQTVSCTYGVRNFSNRAKGFSEIYRCIKKNGFFLFMEFGMPNASIIQKPYEIFLDYFLPFSGSVIAKDRHSYKYLAESIKAFPSPVIIQKELENIGFSHIETIDFISGANNIYILQKK